MTRGQWRDYHEEPAGGAMLFEYGAKASVTRVTRDAGRCVWVEVGGLTDVADGVF